MIEVSRDWGQPVACRKWGPGLRLGRRAVEPGRKERWEKRG